MAYRQTISVRTAGQRGITIVTREVEDVVASSGIGDGICVAFVPHTSAAITINENADSDVQTDLLAAFTGIVPKIDFRHAEGNSDAHLLASLLGCSVTIPVAAGSLVLGRWQGIWFVELDGPRERTLDIHVLKG